MTTQTDYWALFAHEANRIGSPLYASLALSIRDDEKLRQIAAHAKPGQPHANLILAAVHYLLLEGRSHPIAEHYPSINPGAKPVGEPFPLFRDFCLQHESDLVRLISARVTNTNEVARSTALYPAFDLVSREVRKELHLIEIGPSAGFNMNWDRYRYIYRRDGAEVSSGGASDALMTLETELRSERAPEFASDMPKIASRVGLELNPVNLQSAKDRLWLKALIFPELKPRFARLEGAIATALAHPRLIVFGDALDLLEKTVTALPKNGIPVIYHSFVTYQFSSAMRQRLKDIITDLSRTRPLYRVSIEWEDSDHPLTIGRYEDGVCEKKTVADCSPHGAWLNWHAVPGETHQ